MSDELLRDKYAEWVKRQGEAFNEAHPSVRAAYEAASGPAGKMRDRIDAWATSQLGRPAQAINATTRYAEDKLRPVASGIASMMPKSQPDAPAQGVTMKEVDVQGGDAQPPIVHPADRVGLAGTAAGQAQPAPQRPAPQGPPDWLVKYMDKSQ